MITRVSRIEKITGGIFPSWMSDQLGAFLRDHAAGTLGQDRDDGQSG